MKTLLLLRHAKSSWAEPGATDHDRPLNDRGKHDAPRMGRFLLEQQLLPDLIVSSTAKRARKTAERVVAACGYQGDLQITESLYLAQPVAYLRLLQTFADDRQRVLMVGHNPGLEDLVELLTGEIVALPTAALVKIAIDIDRWSDLSTDTPGRLEHIWRPKELPAPADESTDP
jgi:phosphohistidine phosphatase